MAAMNVQSRKAEDCERSLVAEFDALWSRVWPQEGAEERELQFMRANGGRSFDEAFHALYPYCVYHYARDEEGSVAGLCKTFRRVVREVDSGGELSVLALAGVCSRPEDRGRGYGRAVVKDAFARLSMEPSLFGVCLFQTGVQPFYEKLGAGLLSNDFVNSANAADPNANPWWDKVVMAFPAGAFRLEGRVDLGGPGY